MDEYLSKKDLSVYLRISRGTVQKLMKQIPHIKLGKRVLFRKADIDKFMESKLVK
jgi:excisionase family DNA binding protein